MHPMKPMNAPSPRFAWAAWLALALAWIPLGLRGQATVSAPSTMSYQGYLRGTDGNPVGAPAPKGYDMIFRIYDASTGGTQVWAEQQTVVVDNGYFAVQLGQGVAVSGFTNPAGGLASIFTNPAGGARWVDLTVQGLGAGGGNLVITPRVQLLAAPYAYLAQAAGSLVDASGNSLISLSSTNLVVSAPLTASAISVPSLSVGSLTISNSLTIGSSGSSGGFVRTPDGALRIVAGRHRWTNGYPGGSGTFVTEPSPGYAVTRVSAGEYKITFDTSFGTIPSITVMPMQTATIPMYATQGSIGTAYAQVHQSTDAATARKEFNVRFYTQQLGNSYGLYYATRPTSLGESFINGNNTQLEVVYEVYPTNPVDWDFAFVAAGN